MRVLCVLLLAACAADDVTNGGFEIDCGGHPCDWRVVEGDGQTGDGWHAGDPALQLGPGHVVVEQRIDPIALSTRELVLSAAIVCGTDATVRFEMDWFEAGALADSRPVTIDERGVFQLRKLVSTPS